MFYSIGICIVHMVDVLRVLSILCLNNIVAEVIIRLFV